MLRDTADRVGVTSLRGRQISSIQRTIARWESNTNHTAPGERYQVLLVHVYACRAVSGTGTGAEPDLATLFEALRHFNTPEQRISQLAELATQLAAADSDVSPSPPSLPASEALGLKRDESSLAELRQSVAVINSQVGTVSFARLQVQVSPILQACRQLRSDGPMDEFALAAVETCSLAARLAFETGDDDTARLLYEEAGDVAHTIGGRGRRAAVRISYAMATMHGIGDIGAAREIARGGVNDAHHSAGYAIRARAHAVHAETCARDGQPEQARIALERAWKSAEQIPAGDRTSFSTDRLAGFDGLCALFAGDALRAHDQLEAAVNTLISARDAVQRGIVSTDLALARLALGRPDACAQLLHETVELAAKTGGRVAAQRIRQARHALRPWRAEQFISELDDHIHDKLIAR